MGFVATANEFFAQPRFRLIFLLGGGAYFVALFALFRADTYYIDDWESSINPHTSWNHFSRFVATFLERLINLQPSVVDLSPITQLFAIAFLVLGGMILNFTIRKKIDYIGVLAAIPLGLSPHFLENLSYKFDSLSMSFSVLCCIVPFLFRENKIAFFISSVVCLLLMYCSYQASNGIYIIISLYITVSLYFIHKHSLKKAISFLLLCIVAFCIASLIYKLWIVKPVNNYVSDSVLPLSQLASGGLEHLSRYLHLLYSDLAYTPYFYAAAIMAVFFIIHFVQLSVRAKIFSLIVAILFVILGVCLSYGAYIILQKPLFEPRAFIGIGCFVALLCVASINDSLDSSHLMRLLAFCQKILVGFICYVLVIFATAYGNALGKQQEYIYFRADFLLRDLENVLPKDEHIAIEIQQGIGYANAAKPFMNAKHYGNIAKRLIPRVMYGGWFFAYPPLLNHRKFPFGGYGALECKDKPTESTLLLSNHYQDIHKAGSCYVITLKDPKP